MALDLVADFHLTEHQLTHLAHRGYDPAFLKELQAFRFTGDIRAMPEGTVAFADEPLLCLTAPLPTVLPLAAGVRQLISASTLSTTQAARTIQAAQGRPVTQLALGHPQASLLVARATSIGGYTNPALAGDTRAPGLPATGRIPHALVQAFPTEDAAFQAVADSFPHYVLPLDTYHAPTAVHTAVTVADQAHTRAGHQLAAVRLDDGDQAGHSSSVRAVLDAAGWTTTQLLVGGDLDEHDITALLAAGRPIYRFEVASGVGLATTTIGSQQLTGALEVVATLVDYQGLTPTARLRLAGDQATWPARKQAYRLGLFEADLVTREDEPAPQQGEALVHPVMRAGQILPEPPALRAVQEYVRAQLKFLPERYRTLDRPASYPVDFSQALRDLRRDLAAR